MEETEEIRRILKLKPRVIDYKLNNLKKYF